MPADNAAQLPPPYRRAEPVRLEKHWDLQLDRSAGYHYAQEVRVVPLGLNEVVAAHITVPIVVRPGPTPMLVGFYGLRPGTNLMIDNSGRWLSGVYIPSFLRRYPFLMRPLAVAADAPADAHRAQRRVLCIDDSSPLLSSQGGESLFANNKPTRFLQENAEYANAAEEQFDQARAFCRALISLDQIVGRDLTANLETGERIRLPRFGSLEEAKLRQLPEKAVVDWHRRGWLAAAYALHASQQNWNRLIDLAVEFPM